MMLLAWMVGDYEEAEVVFAETEEDAEREATVHAYDPDYTKRVPEFDQYAPGPVPTQALLDAGWWRQCSRCDHRVRDDGCEDCAEKSGATACTPIVVDGDEVYCSAGCHDAEKADRAARKLIADACRERCARIVAERWPGAVIESNTPDSEGSGQLEMRVPGCACLVRWTESDPAHVWRAHCDIAAWEAFEDKCKEDRNG